MSMPQPLHLSNIPIRGVSVCSYTRARLRAVCRDRVVICYWRHLSHNQVEVARSVAARVEMK